MVDLLRQHRWKSIAGRSEIGAVRASLRNGTVDPVHPDGTSARRSSDPDLHVGRALLRVLPYLFRRLVEPFRPQLGNIPVLMDVLLDIDWKMMASVAVVEERDVDPVQPWKWVWPFFVYVSWFLAILCVWIVVSSSCGRSGLRPVAKLPLLQTGIYKRKKKKREIFQFAYFPGMKHTTKVAVKRIESIRHTRKIFFFFAMSVKQQNIKKKIVRETRNGGVCLSNYADRVIQQCAD